MSVVFTTLSLTSCGGGNDTRQNMINAQDAYLKDKNLDDQLAEKAAEVAKRSGKWCVTPKPEIPCPTCGDHPQQVVKETVVANPNVSYNYNYYWRIKKGSTYNKTKKIHTRLKKTPCIPCYEKKDSILISKEVIKTVTLNTICIDGEKYVISADQNIPQQAYSNYRMVNGVIYQKVSSLK